MADPRFYTRKGPFSLDELAAISGATLHEPAAASRTLIDVASLEDADAETISFLDNPKYTTHLERSQAGACVISAEMAARAPEGMALLISTEPYRAYAKIATHFYPEALALPDGFTDAPIDPTAQLADGVTLAPGVVIGAKAEIGEGTAIGPNTIIGPGVVIGQECQIGGHCTITHSLLGDGVVIHPGARIGQAGFGFAMGAEGHLKVPQLGRVIIEDDVDIGANTTIDRGSGPDTVIGAGSRIDNLVQIGHNVRLGRGCVVVSQAGISGSTKIGDFVVLGGQAGVAGHMEIASGVRLAGKSGVTKSLTQPGDYGGFPAVPVRDWRRREVTLAKLSKKDKTAS